MSRAGMKSKPNRAPAMRPFLELIPACDREAIRFLAARGIAVTILHTSQGWRYQLALP